MNEFSGEFFADKPNEIMEDLNGLTNEELKYRLTQFGFPNLPVTNTTRKVLIKKLKHYMDNGKSKLKRETTYATRYSSDEDYGNSDSEQSTKNVAEKKNRATIGSITVNRNVSPSTAGAQATGANNVAVGVTAATAKDRHRHSNNFSGSNGSNSDEHSDTNADDAENSDGLSLARGRANGSCDSSILNGSTKSYKCKDIVVGYNPTTNGSADESDGKTLKRRRDTSNHLDDSLSPHMTTDFTKRLMSFRQQQGVGVDVLGGAASKGKNIA